MTEVPLTLHIHSGDYSAAAAGRRISGEHLVWTDNLFEGPLPSVPWEADAWLEARAAAMAPYLGSHDCAKRMISKKYDQFRECLPKASEITLWFDSCMYDMMLLCQFLTFARDFIAAETPVWLICEERREDGRRFAGYAELTDDELAGMLVHRRLLEAADWTEAESCWAAFTDSTPERCAEIAEGKFHLSPYLPFAAQRLLEQLPCSYTGLNRLERAVVETLLDGCSSLMELFAKVSAREERPYFGDAVLWKTVNGLSEGESPLLELHPPQGIDDKMLPVDIFRSSESFRLEDWTVTATLAGMRSLWGWNDGKRSVIDGRWLANVRLLPGNDWRWDRWNRRLVRKG